MMEYIHVVKGWPVIILLCWTVKNIDIWNKIKCCMLKWVCYNVFPSVGHLQSDSLLTGLSHSTFSFRLALVYQWRTKTHAGQRMLLRSCRRDLNFLVIFPLLTLCAVPLHNDPDGTGPSKSKGWWSCWEPGGCGHYYFSPVIQYLPKPWALLSKSANLGHHTGLQGWSLKARKLDQADWQGLVCLLTVSGFLYS